MLYMFKFRLMWILLRKKYWKSLNFFILPELNIQFAFYFSGLKFRQQMIFLFSPKMKDLKSAQSNDCFAKIK